MAKILVGGMQTTAQTARLMAQEGFWQTVDAAVHMAARAGHGQTTINVPQPFSHEFDEIINQIREHGFGCWSHSPDVIAISWGPVSLRRPASTPVAAKEAAQPTVKEPAATQRALF